MSELNTYNTNWYNVKQGIMQEILRIKFEQCSAFRQELMNSGDNELVEDTNHNYWARGKDGNGQNILGILLMNMRDRYRDTDMYIPPANDVAHPCYQCGEGNHTQQSCRWECVLQCTRCQYLGHKSKDCPQSYGY